MRSLWITTERGWGVQQGGDQAQQRAVDTDAPLKLSAAVASGLPAAPGVGSRLPVRPGVMLRLAGSGDDHRHRGWHCHSRGRSGSGLAGRQSARPARQGWTLHQLRHSALLPRMATPSQSCRPRAGTSTWPASAPTRASVPKPPHASLPRWTRPVAAGRPLADASY